MGVLNLVLHGLFAIVEEPYRIVAVVPFVSDHVNYEIEVFADKPLHYGRGNYELLGVKAGQKSAAMLGASFPADKTARIGRGAANFTEVFCVSPPAYASFVLPRPDPGRVYCCECFERGKDLDFRGRDAHEIAATRLARIVVVSYDFDDVNRVHFSGLPGFQAHFKPGTADGDPVKYANVAIISAGPHPHVESITNSFDQMMKALIPSKNIRLHVMNPGANPASDCHIPGVDRATLDALTAIHSNFGITDCIPTVVNNA